MSPERDLARIRGALEAARRRLARLAPGAMRVELKDGGDPVTAADRSIDELLRATLPRPGEGWLSEETSDDARRLDSRRVWIVDPLDGTREFVGGIPEYCVSVGLAVDGEPVAGGICNPASGQTILGARGLGVLLNGRPARISRRRSLHGALVLASRSEVGRGEWERFRDGPFRFRAVGSVAYKMALVAAGLADATFSLVPKHEWDVAGGAALVLAAGGVVLHPDGTPPRFNRRTPHLAGLLAAAPGLADALLELLGRA
ncbi:MAG: 3'(2'),5'-bisphosphate nucleotidase CysQ [Acidobacteriota bacterium]